MGIRSILVWAALLGVCVPLATGQLYYGQIEGQVSDPSGALVPGARVVARNDQTGVRIETTSSADGNYVLSSVNPGVYTIAIEAQGFKRYVQKGVEVSVGERLRLNIALELGSTTEQVTVTAALPPLNVVDAELSQTMTRSYVDKLYVPLRNPLNLVMLAPGVNVSGGYASSGFADAGDLTAGLSVNGGGSTSGSNEMTVDGVSVTVPRGRGNVASAPSSDALSEFSVKTTNIDVSLGRTNGGTIAMATRSGTNEFHGSFEGFYGDPALNANGWFNNRNRLPRADVNRRYYSGAGGGPIRRDKTFFFVSWQRDSDNSPFNQLARVPSADERQGDFSATLSPSGSRLMLYDPLTTVVTGNKATRQPIAGNRLNPSRFDPMGKALMNFYPQANLDVAPQLGRPNWAGSFLIPSRAVQWSVRVDHTLTGRHRLFGRFARITQLTECDGCPAGIMDVPIQDAKALTFMLNHTWTVSPTLLASFSYSWARYADLLTYSANRLDPADIKVPEIITANAINKAWPRVFLAADGVPNVGGRVRLRANNNFQIVPSFTSLQSTHILKFGADLRKVTWSQTVSNQGAGFFNFDKKFTRSDPFANATDTTSGSAMAALLLGYPDSGSLSYSQSPYLSSLFLAFYVQDTWKVSPKLTITPGIRWEAERPYVERYDRIVHGFDRTAELPGITVPGMSLRGGLLLAGIDGNPRTQGSTDWNNFSPRIGFAYQVTPRTVLRGGYSLFYVSGTYNQENALPTSSLWGLNATIVGSLDSGATPYATVRNPFPAGLPPVIGASQGILSRMGDSTGTIFDQGAVVPYNQQWTFGVQRQLSQDWIIEASYMHILSLKGFGGATAAATGFNLNELSDAYLNLGTSLLTRVPNPFYGVFPATTSLGAASTVIRRQLLLAYPQFTSVTLYTNANSANYNALQLRADRRMRGGLTLMWNYTFSKQLERNTISLVNPGRNISGISGLDRTHVMNLAAVYELPVGRGRRFLGKATRAVDLLAGGWTVSSSVRIASGAPLQFSHPNGRPVRTCNASKSGSVSSRLGDLRDASGKVLNPYFDTSCFAPLPNQFTVPPEPIFFGEIRAPGRRQMDAAVWKSFQVWERVHFQVRGEAANLTNTPQFGPPGTNLGNASTFGVIQTASAPRIIQLAFRATF